jgi:chromate reductase
MQVRSVLLINGSSYGRRGNSQRLLDRTHRFLPGNADRIELVLAELPCEGEEGCVKQWSSALARASAIIIATGTYWDSWGWPLQRYLEWMTPTEGTSLWLGKPVGVLVTMHSVGGKCVLSRLQGVLSTFGAVIPPMSGLVYSTVAHEHFQRLIGEHGADRVRASDVSADLWSLDDIEIVCHNLVMAMECGEERPWRGWAVDRSRPSVCWLD